MNLLDPAHHGANTTTLSDYIIRIEMPDASWDDYLELHARMNAIGFRKSITSDDGQTFNLMDATYYGLSLTEAPALRDLVRDIACSVRPGSKVLVMEILRAAWTLPLVA